jgi:hypothetical protein
MTHRLAAGILAAAALACAADTSQWSSLRELKKGDRIGVIQAGMKRVEGRFESSGETSITLVADQTVTLAKDDVVRVYRRPRLNRAVRAVLGAGIGAAAGGLVDGTFGTYLRNEGHGPEAGVITLIAAGAGAGVGAASGGGYRTVYQRR